MPLWGIAVFFVYALRRVNCRRCGVKVEAVPWATGKHRLTTTYMQLLALWARRLAWSEVAAIFHTSWEKVFHAVEWMVQWGLEHRKLTRIRSRFAVSLPLRGCQKLGSSLAYAQNDSTGTSILRRTQNRPGAKLISQLTWFWGSAVLNHTVD